jgi:hypothetical protein
MKRAAAAAAVIFAVLPAPASLTVTGPGSRAIRPVAASSWTARKAPLPAGAAAGSSLGVAIDGVACPPVTAAAAVCVVVGGYPDAAGNHQLVLLSGQRAAWSASKAPLPAGADTKPPRGYPVPTVTSLACPLASVCVAVGYYTGPSSTSAGLLLSMHGSSWVATQAPLPANAASTPDAALGGVACPSATNCAAVGDYGDSASTGGGLLVSGHGSSWTGSDASLPVDAGSSVALDALACQSATMCVAVGQYTDSSGRQQGLLLTGHGPSWAATQAPLPAGAATNPLAGLYDVACPSATTCVVAGGYTDSAGNQQVLLLSGHGSAWTATRAPLPPGAGITSIACPSAAMCVAVGESAAAAGAEQGLLLTGHGSSWTATAAPLPPGAASSTWAGLSAVACPSTMTCVATGFYLDSAGHQQGLLLTRIGSFWVAGKAPLPAGAAANPDVFLDGIACASRAMCTAVGDYADSAGHVQGLLLAGASLALFPPKPRTGG